MYEEDVLDFWKDHFQMIILSEVMRQKEDLVFAQLLNRLRAKKTALLLQAVKNQKYCLCNALHIFATNKEVHRHNTETIHNLHTDIKDPRTGGMKRQKKPVIEKKDDLLDTIQIALGICVMVTRNLDVEDGVVNGCFRNIVNIVTKTKDGIDTVQMLGLQPDNPNAGKKHHRRVQGEEDDLVYIERSKNI